MNYVPNRILDPTLTTVDYRAAEVIRRKACRFFLSISRIGARLKMQKPAASLCVIREIYTTFRPDLNMPSYCGVQKLKVSDPSHGYAGPRPAISSSTAPG